MSEQQLQSAIIKWLKSKGCYVIKAQAGPGVPVGCPDIIALIDGGGYIALEVKSSSSSKFQPLQKETIKKLDSMYFCRAVWPDNWSLIRSEIEVIV